MSSESEPQKTPPLARRLAGELGPLAALAAVGVLLVAAAPLWRSTHAIASTRNIRVVLVQTSTVAVAALGMTVVIIAGGIDLSAGTGLVLAACVLAWMLKADYSAAAAITAGVSTGVACGVFNGAVISLLRLMPFIVTLGTMTAYLGVAKLVASNSVVRPHPEQVPDWLGDLVSTAQDAQWAGLPLGVWLALALAVLLAAVLRLTVLGRHVFALGSNEATARLCGVNVTRLKILVYAIGGLFLGIAGIYQFARLTQGNPNSGLGMELRVIAAVVIGGGSLNGGQGTVLGTLCGAAIMGVIASGSTALGLSNPVQDIILGAIIVAAVALDQIRHRRAGGEIGN
jgi:ribose transport system permease protein